MKIKPPTINNKLLKQITKRLIDIRVPVPERLKHKAATALRTKLHRFINEGATLIVHDQPNNKIIISVTTRK